MPRLRFGATAARCALVSALLLISAGCNPPAADTGADAAEAEPTIEHGHYLSVVAGCNDCHTDGYLFSGGQVPEEDWLLGSPMGWRGPWGTTYAKNLRLAVSGMTEDEWVELLRTRTTLPPMPWMNVNRMTERDARSLYRYIASLPVRGEAMPATVPPDQEPETPYISLFPVEPDM